MSRSESQLELLLVIWTTPFSLYICINQRADDNQIVKNKNYIISPAHNSEIQEERLKHLDIKVAYDRYFYMS